MAETPTPPNTPPPNPITEPVAWTAFRNSQLAPVVMAMRDMLNTVVDVLHESTTGTEHPIQEYQVAGMLSLVNQKLRQLQKIFHDEATRMGQYDAIREGGERAAEALADLPSLLANLKPGTDIATEAERWLKENGT